MPISIVATSELTDRDLLAVQELVALCQAHDGTFKVPYLSNMLNVDKTMPAFFLAYLSEELVGFLAVYADSLDSVELSLLVKPSYRCQGVAGQLYRTFLEATADYGLTGLSFISERVFLDGAPGLLEAWGLSLKEESEFLLTRDRLPAPAIAPEKSPHMRLAVLDDVPAIAAFQAQAFDEPADLTLNYAREAVDDPSALLYVALDSDQVVASCTVDQSTKDNYLYGLAVADTYRGQGIGSALVSYVIGSCLEENNKPFQIAVAKDNLGAKSLYERLGFVVQTELLYLTKLGK